MTLGEFRKEVDKICQQKFNKSYDDCNHEEKVKAESIAADKFPIDNSTLHNGTAEDLMSRSGRHFAKAKNGRELYADELQPGDKIVYEGMTLVIGSIKQTGNVFRITTSRGGSFNLREADTVEVIG